MPQQRYVDAAGNELTVTYGTVPAQPDPSVLQLQAQAVQMQTAGATTLIPTAANANTMGTWSRKEAPKVGSTKHCMSDRDVPLWYHNANIPCAVFVTCPPF